jgi:hypothetical protein
MLCDYVEESDSEGKWQRALDVGMIKTDEGIMVNVHQLQNIVGGCKSLINRYLRRHYDSCPLPSESSKIFSMMPEIIRNDRNIYEHWSLRYYCTSSAIGPLPVKAWNHRLVHLLASAAIITRKDKNMYLNHVSRLQSRCPRNLLQSYLNVSSTKRNSHSLSLIRDGFAALFCPITCRVA